MYIDVKSAWCDLERNVITARDRIVTISKVIIVSNFDRIWIFRRIDLVQCESQIGIDWDIFVSKFIYLFNYRIYCDVAQYCMYRDLFSGSTREVSSLRFDFRRIDRGSTNQRQSLVTAITIRLGKHPAGVSSGRTRPCWAVNLASAIISRVRRRPVPSRFQRCDQPTRKMDGSSRASSLLHRIYSARVSAWTSLRFRHSRPSPRSLRWTPLLLPIFGCEEWQHAHIQHRSERKEILHLEVITFYCRVHENG